MKKIQDLLFDLEKKVESSLTELSKLKNEKKDLLYKNQILNNEKNELNQKEIVYANKMEKELSKKY